MRYTSDYRVAVVLLDFRLLGLILLRLAVCTSYFNSFADHFD